MTISVIIPVFNVKSSHLTACLNSVLCQSLRPHEYEIILVDDGSTTADTLDIIQRYQSASHIQVIRHQKNLGLNEARRTGTAAANGDFVLYVDGDDVLTSDAIESLRLHALKTDADLVLSYFYRFNETNLSLAKDTHNGKPLPTDYQQRLAALLSIQSSFTMCGRLIRRSLLNKHVFDLPQKFLHEDMVTLTRIMFTARRVVSIDRPIYFYRWNPQGITSNYSENHAKGMLFAFNDWINQADQHGFINELAQPIAKGITIFLDTAVSRIAYSLQENPKNAFQTLKLLWDGLQTLPVQPNAQMGRKGLKVLHQVFSDANPSVSRFTALCQQWNLNSRSAHYDSSAMLPYGLEPSAIARQLKGKIVIICQVDYHLRNAATFAKALALRGYSCTILDNSAFAAGGKRSVCAADLRLLWRTQYLKIEKSPYGLDWLCTAELVITFNDFNDDFREALEYRRLLGLRSVSMVEGINDFLRIDFVEPRYLPYRRCDTVFLAGQDDAQYFEDRTTYVIGLPVVEQLAQKQPKFPSQPLAVLNVNFTYGVLENCRDAFVKSAREAFERAGWDWIITQHPMDKGALTSMPVAKQTQYELIDKGTVFVSRFATGLLEALASGKAAIYFNPHGEKVAKFQKPMGAFDIATNTNELVAALNKVQADRKAGVDFRARALPFLAHHTSYQLNGATAAERFADAVVEIVESDPEPNRRVARLFFERLETQDSFMRRVPGLVFGDLDRRHYAQFEETDLVASYFGNRGRLMIDVGANIGQSADTFLGKGWTVHSFEPDPKNRQRLEELAPHHPRLYINTLAVSDQSGNKVAFYASEESTGISSLSAFTQGHSFLCEVETITLADYCRERHIGHVDFLKIDVEGHDKFVLDGYDWTADKPDVITAEFEDAKTLQNGYSTHDLAGSLLAQGYSVYVSEWMPIERYGLAHDWRRLICYQPELNFKTAWGNLIAFLDDPGEEVLRTLVQETIKFSPKPKHRLEKPFDKSLQLQSPASDAFRRANVRFRAGEFEAALQDYLSLYNYRPMKIYEMNALWAARRLGYTDVKSAEDLGTS